MKYDVWQDLEFVYLCCCLPAPGGCEDGFNDTCHVLANCIDDKCVCKDGYEGDGWMCTGNNFIHN